MTQAIADQLFLSYMGRAADTQWRSNTTTLITAQGGNPTKALKDAFFTAGVAEGVYAAADSPSTLVNKFFLNTFGFAARTDEQTFWGNLLSNGTYSAGELVWQMFSSYANNTTALPSTYVVPMQSKLMALAAYSNALTDPTINASYSQINSTASAAGRTYLSGVTSQATAATAITNVAATVATVSIASGQTFVLTTAVDSSGILLGSAGTTSTTGNDTFTATAATTAPTFTASDTINGGGGTNTLNLLIDTLAANSVPVASVSNIQLLSVRNVSGQAQTIAMGDFGGATITGITSDRSTGAMTITGMTAGQTLTINGNGSVTNGTMANTYAATVTSATLNVTGGTTGGNITQTAAANATQTINSTGAANIIGTFAMGGGTTVSTLNINAATALTTGNITNFTGTASKIVISGAATSSTGVGVTIGTVEAATVASVDASGLTAGGVSLTMSANTSLVVTGGAGNDRITTGVALVTGSVNAGAGTADRLTMANNADINSLALGQKYSGFEVLALTAGRTVDMDHLATNNTITSLRFAGSATLTNVSAAQAGAVQILGDSTASIGVKNASTVGNIDTVAITVNDEVAGVGAVGAITLTTPVLTGVEILNLIATDGFTINALTSATSLTSIVVTGAGNTSITSGALALNVNTSVNAGASTGTVVLDFSAATTNGAAITGSSTAANTISGGAGADVIVGGTAVDIITSSAGTGADTINFQSDAAIDVFNLATVTGRATFTNFDAGTSTTTEDIFTVTSAGNGNGGETVVTAAAAIATITSDRTIVVEQAIGSAAALTTGGTATLVLADFTATTLTNVAAYLSERFRDVSGTTTATETAVFVVNNGTNSYVYAFQDTATANVTIDANELTLVGVVNGAILLNADVAQV